jgi:misacylated tRNA(Ala) deacylase
LNVLTAGGLAVMRSSRVTELLYLADSYLRDFDAVVTEVTPDGVVLDRTAFYPGGGGQPHDTGTLRSGERV